MLGGLIGNALGMYFFDTQPRGMELVSLIIVTLTVCYLLPLRLSESKSRSSSDG